MTLTPGDKAPHFSLPASTGGTISLSEAAGRKVVIYFYPKDDTPGCVKEACGFRDANEELRAVGVEVLGVSADSLKSHRRFVEKYRLNFPLLSDEEKTVSTAYGAWGEKTAWGKTTVGMRRMTFLIDEEGMIRKVWPKVRPDGHAEEVLKAVKA